MSEDDLALGIFLFLWVFVLFGFLVANCNIFEQFKKK